MTITPPLSTEDFERHRPRILAKLHQHSATLAIAGGERAAAAIIRSVFAELFGAKRAERERHAFFIFVAPIFRRLALTRVANVNIGTTSQLRVADLEEWLSRLEDFDAQCVQMIDLHYFIGLSARRTAQTLGISPKVVIRDLRFAKAWLRARARWVPPG